MRADSDDAYNTQGERIVPVSRIGRVRMVTRLEMLVDRLDSQLSRRRKELTDIRLMSVGSFGPTDLLSSAGPGVLIL